VAAPAKPRSAAAKPAANPSTASQSTTRKPATRKPATRKPATGKAATRQPAARKPVVMAATSTTVSTKRASSSVAKRMAKAVNRLATTTPPALINDPGHPTGAQQQLGRD
jgi:hypothetical protein